VTRAIYGVAPLRYKLIWVAIDEARNPALADLAMSYRTREIPDHIPRRRKDSLSKLSDISHELQLLLWAKSLLAVVSVSCFHLESGLVRY
jgi:hypothetical protein